MTTPDRRPSLKDSIRRGSNLFFEVLTDGVVVDGKVSPEPPVAASTPSGADVVIAAETPSASTMQSEESHSLLLHVVQTTAMAVVPSLFTILLLYLYFEQLAPLMRKHSISPSSAGFFLGFVIMIFLVRVIRRRDERMRRLYWIYGPASLSFSALFLYLWGGDVGLWTAPMVTVMYILTLTVAYPFEKPAQRKGNIFRYFLTRIPTPIVSILTIFIPPAATVLPARLLSDIPWAYTLFCGIGYPALSFFVRKGFVSFMQKLYSKKVQDGSITVKQCAKIVGDISLMMSVCLHTGNVILLYQSSSKLFSLLGAFASILIEVAGKAYSTKVTQMAMSDLLESNSSLGGISVLAQAEAGVNGTIEMAPKDALIVELTKTNQELLMPNQELLIEVEGLRNEVSRLKGEPLRLEGNAAMKNAAEAPQSDLAKTRTTPVNDDASKEVENEKRTQRYWDSILAMLALRWTNDNIAEIGCIVAAVYASIVLKYSPHSLPDQVEVFFYFITCEVITDATLVYCLNRWYKVPFLRVQLPSFRSFDFWADAIVTSLAILGMIFVFNYIQEKAIELFPST